MIRLDDVISPGQIESTHFSFRLQATRLLAPSGTRDTGKRLFAGNNVDEEVELVRLAECLGDVCPRESSPLVRVGDDECARCNLRDEDWDTCTLSGRGEPS